MDPSVIIISDSDEEDIKAESIERNNNTTTTTQSNKLVINSNIVVDNIPNRFQKRMIPEVNNRDSKGQNGFRPSIRILLSDEESSRDLLPSTLKDSNNGTRISTDNQKSISTTKLTRNSNKCTKNVRYNKERRLLITKLEKELERIETRLEIAENYELSLDDLNNSKSKYIQLHKLRERYRTTWERYCSATNFIPKSIYSKIKVTSSSNQLVNKKMEMWIKKYNDFPNFVDVQQQMERIYADLNGSVFDESSRSIITSGSLNSEVSAIFLEIGLQIVRSRKRFYKFYFESYITPHGSPVDPADIDNVLNNKLTDNFNAFLTAMVNVEKHFSEIQSPNDETNDIDDQYDEDVNDTEDEISDYDTSSLSSLSEQSESSHNDTCVDKHPECYADNSSSGNISVENDDEQSSLDNLYVNEITQNNTFSLINNTITQITNSPKLIDKVKPTTTTTTTATTSTATSGIVVTNKTINDCTHSPMLLSNSNMITPKRALLVTVSSTVPQSKPNNSNTINPIPTMSIPKIQENGLKIFKPKILPIDVIDSMKNENAEIISMPIPCVNSTNDTIPASSHDCSNNRFTTSLEHLNNNLQTAMSNNSELMTVSHGLNVENSSDNTLSCGNIDTSCRAIPLTRSTSNDFSTDNSNINHPKVSNTINPNLSNYEIVSSIDHNQKDQHNTINRTDDIESLKSIPLDQQIFIHQKSSNNHNDNTNVDQTSNLMAIILAQKYKTNSLLPHQVMPLSVRLTENVMATVLPRQTNNMTNDITVIPESLANNNTIKTKKITPIITTVLKTNKLGRSESSNAPPPPPPPALNKNLGTSHSNSKNKNNCPIKRDILEVEKKIRNVSKLFDQNNLSQLTKRDFIRLNTALHLIETVEKSTANKPKITPPDNISKKRNATRNSSFKIPKVGEQKKKNKPINPAQPSKKAKF